MGNKFDILGSSSAEPTRQGTANGYDSPKPKRRRNSIHRFFGVLMYQRNPFATLTNRNAPIIIQLFPRLPPSDFYPPLSALLLRANGAEFEVIEAPLEGEMLVRQSPLFLRTSSIRHYNMPLDHLTLPTRLVVEDSDKIYKGTKPVVVGFCELFRLKVFVYEFLPNRELRSVSICTDRKIADFGLARSFQDDKGHISTAIAGTFIPSAPLVCACGVVSLGGASSLECFYWLAVAMDFLVLALLLGGVCLWCQLLGTCRFFFARLRPWTGRCFFGWWWWSAGFGALGV
ncbi:hypothetical protein IFM89_031660 [Coptis chinensis]|uniref:Uncharacterized protein n=1 Tax=Coptis chinensis TaxID=261450 RepID=A0A835H769_9MAGN|nr:hypothetical protein IFM89_031660 [Coptis chinensis]